jgi:hypothetical protein
MIKYKIGAIVNLKGKCLYQLGVEDIESEGRFLIYCGKKTKKVLIKEKDMNPWFRYEPFCKEHEKEMTIDEEE